MGTGRCIEVEYWLAQSGEWPYWEDNVSSATLPVVWDAFKAYMRVQYISAMKAT